LKGIEEDEGPVLLGKDCCCCLLEAVTESEAASAPIVSSSSGKSYQKSWKWGGGDDLARFRKVFKWSYHFQPHRMFKKMVQSATGSLKSWGALAMPFLR
jgi:hypothetical protein